MLRRIFDTYYSYLGEDIVVAELGCGTGTFLKQLAVVFPNSQILGIDIDPKVVSVARNSVPSAKVTEGSFTQTPWQNESVQLVTTALIYDYSERGIFDATYTLAEFSREIYRILTPGGTYIPSSGDWLMYEDPQVFEAFQAGGLVVQDHEAFTSFDKPLDK